jgi:hypothetical protein
LVRIQKLLKDNELLNKAVNGFWAKSGHSGTHTKAYVRFLLKTFKGVTTAAQAKAALRIVWNEVKKGNFQK